MPMSKVFVVSDLHLMDRNEEFLFNKEKEALFCQLCNIIEESSGKLVLAGDIFDFTGMTPCRVGQKEFFLETVPASAIDESLVSRVSQLRSTEDFLRATQKVFPDFFNSLGRLAEEKRLVYLPGNHDCDFLNPTSKEIFEKVLGVSSGVIEWTRRFEQDHSLLVLHGNEYDPPNVTNESCQNPGFIFTSALYHGVLPALRMLGLDNKVLSALPAVRPEENVVAGLEHYLGDETCHKIFVGLARLLQRNGYFRGMSSIPGWFFSNEVPLISKLIQQRITAKRICRMLPNDQKLLEDARGGARKLRKDLVEKYPAYESTVIVFGHTHELDQHERYINLGTWNDHLSSLAPGDIANPQTALPVLVLNDPHRDVSVYNIRAMPKFGSLLDCPIIASAANHK